MQERLQCYVIPAVFLLLNIILAFDKEGNNSEIFVSYSGHSEAKDNMPIMLPKAEVDIEDNKHSVPETHTTAVTESDRNREEEDVIFIPNDKPVFRNEDDYLENDPVKITDMMNNRKISDVIRDESGVTESTNEDIMFISGKNNENVEQSNKKNKHSDSFTKTKDKEIKRKRLDCSKLDCDNTVNSICGGKLEDNKWKYRLFLNECFFRKVNCAFRYSNNRYKLVGLNKCSHIGSYSDRRPNFQPIAMLLMSNIEKTRRSFSSRRSLNADINGQACSHPCPITCTEKYEPQCAVSNTGQRHTFLNHCKLDYNSCSYKVVWHIRPLSECVGGKKADVQQNRGFIAWMQKAGIVDNRGRLTLSKGPRPR